MMILIETYQDDRILTSPGLWDMCYYWSSLAHTTNRHGDINSFVRFLAQFGFDIHCILHNVEQTGCDQQKLNNIYWKWCNCWSEAMPIIDLDTDVMTFLYEMFQFYCHISTYQDDWWHWHNCDIWTWVGNLTHKNVKKWCLQISLFLHYQPI